MQGQWVEHCQVSVLDSTLCHLFIPPLLWNSKIKYHLSRPRLLTRQSPDTGLVRVLVDVMFPYQLLPGPYKLAIVNSTLSSNVIQYLVFENLRLILGQEKKLGNWNQPINNDLMIAWYIWAEPVVTCGTSVGNYGYSLKQWKIISFFFKD